MTIRTTLLDAIRALSEGRIADAEAGCLEALEADPTNAQAHTLLARVLLSSDRAGDALAIAHAATRLDPDDADAFAAFGDALRMLGDVEHARDVFAHATLLAPDRAELLLAYGQTLLALDDTEPAVRALLRSLQLAPATIEGYRLLAQALHRQGRNAEAVEAFLTALAFQPEAAELHFEVGNFCRRIGALPEALECFEKVSALMPDMPAGFINAGVVLRAMGRTQEAVARHRAAIDIDSEQPTAQMNLGLCLRDLERYDEAERALRTAIALQPGDPTAHYNLGTTLLAAQRPETALLAFDEAIQLDDNFAAAHANRGVALKVIGELDAAEAALRRAVEIQPTLARPYLTLARLGRLEDTSVLESLLSSPSVHRADALDLRFAAALTRDRDGACDEAFAHLRAGNALARRPWDPMRHSAVVDRMIETFDGSTLVEMDPIGASTEPIFVVGVPRAGTTLVEQILASHPDVFGAGERTEIEECAKAALHTFAHGVPYPEFVPDLDATQRHVLAEAYAMKLHEASAGAAFATDKMPGNFLHLGFIAALFPNAKVIHVRRHPLDLALSNYMQLYQNDMVPWSYDLEHIACYLNDHNRLMDHWREVLPLTILDVDYELVVADIETAARRMLAHCGLPWDDAVLNPQATKRPVFTASSAQVRKPVYASAVGRWKAYVHHLRPVIENLAFPVPGLDAADDEVAA